MDKDWDDDLRLQGWVQVGNDLLSPELIDVLRALDSSILKRLACHGTKWSPKSSGRNLEIDSQTIDHPRVASPVSPLRQRFLCSEPG